MVIAGLGNSHSDEVDEWYEYDEKALQRLRRMLLTILRDAVFV